MGACFPCQWGRAGAEQPSAAVTLQASSQPLPSPTIHSIQLPTQKHSFLTMPLSINSFSSHVSWEMPDEAK